MGCDEHLYAERYDGRQWIHVSPPRDFKSYDDDAFYDAWGCHIYYHEEYPEDHADDPAIRWAFGRNYTAYAELAGVRNYEYIIPVAPERGFPNDASPEVRRSREYYGIDGHSDTEIDLAEMEAAGDRLGDRWQELIVLLRGVAAEHGVAHEHVRIVVWFDN